MKKSPIKKTSDKSRSPSKSRFTDKASLSQNSSNLYYCHYKNAMYMGGIKSFKKDGKGILLHDDGISALTSYYNDLLHGHNIFFDNYGILSAIYNKNKLVEAAYRTQGFLVYLNYNGDGQLEGKAILLNFITKSIIYSDFRKGNMADKSEQTDFSLLNRVFQLGQLNFLIGSTHSKVIKYEFQKISLIETQKQGNRIIIGFQKNGFINGLGFNFLIRGSHGGYNPDTHRNEDEFELRLIERGYYINTQLNGMGEKMFKNGNIYVGEFKNNVFQGHGILKNSDKKNWVSGYFQNGNLKQLIQYNSQGDQKKFRKIIQALHQKKMNWINNDVQIINFNLFVDQIQKIIKVAPNRNIKSLEERKQQVLKKIQEKFISQPNGQFQNQISIQSLNDLKNTKINSTSGRKFINNFTPNQENNSRRNNQLGISFQAQSPPKISKNSPGKIKIFERSGNNQNSNKKQGESRVSKSPINSRLISSGIKKKAYINEPFDERYNMDTSREMRKANTSGNLAFPLSSDRESIGNRDNLDSKRMVAKNKIFKYLQKQQQSSPKFIYTKIDSRRDNQ